MVHGSPAILRVPPVLKSKLVVLQLIVLQGSAWLGQRHAPRGSDGIISAVLDHDVRSGTAARAGLDQHCRPCSYHVGLVAYLKSAGDEGPFALYLEVCNLDFAEVLFYSKTHPGPGHDHEHV